MKDLDKLRRKPDETDVDLSDLDINTNIRETLLQREMQRYAAQHEQEQGDEYFSD